MSKTSLIDRVAFTISLILFTSSALAQSSTIPLQGQFRVNELGAAVYTLPIDAPAGRGGMKPSISLSYSSSGGDGYLGHGWNLSAASTISRCPQTIAQDGKLRGVKLDNKDKLCLDGQRLVLVRGAYGSDGSQYRKEIDDATLVTARGWTQGGAPEYFTVTNKSGETHYYGDPSKDFSDQAGNKHYGDALMWGADSQGAPVVRQWSIKGIEDNLGNYISYHYNTTTTEQYLSSIDYSGHSNGELPYRSVKFNYINHTKSKSGYIYGGKFTMSKLLDNIELTLDGQSQKSYFLSYNNPVVIEDKTKLIKIIACIDKQKTNCTTPLTFDWTDDRPKGQTQTLSYSGPYVKNLNLSMPSDFMPFAEEKSAGIPNGDNATAQVFDMDGDGKSDMVYTRGGSWYKRSLSDGAESVMAYTSQVGGSTYARSIDFDGDGQRDLLVAKGEGYNWEVLSFKPSTIQETTCNVTPGWHAACQTSPKNVSYTRTSLNIKATGMKQNSLVADVNGDALEDIVFFDNNYIKWYQNLGGRFAPASTLYTFNNDVTEAITIAGLVETSEGFKSSSAIDINGDGLTDIIIKVKSVTSKCHDLHGQYISPYAPKCTLASGNRGILTTEEKSSWRVLVSDGEKFTFLQDITLDNNEDTLRVADINGDGLTDVLYVSNNEWKQRLSNGRYIGAERATGVATGSSHKIHTYFLDLNADGRADILAANQDGTVKMFQFHMSVPSLDHTAANWELRGGIYFDYTNSLRFADIEGVGNLDMLVLRGNNWYRRDNTAYPNSNTISTITEGFGVKTNISYAHLTDSTNGEPSVYKNQASSNVDSSESFSIVAPMRVVKRVTTQVTNTSQLAISYEYGGLLVNRVGRGFAGFEMLRTRDEQSGIITETLYDQKFPTIGAPIVTKQFYKGSKLNEASNTYSYQQLTSIDDVDYARKNQIISTETTRQYGSDDVVRNLIKTVTNNQFDDWGNVNTSVVTVTDLQSFSQVSRVEIQNEYNGNGGGAAKGRLSKSIVTKSRGGQRISVADITKSSAFTYYENGLIKDSIVAPGDIRYKFTTRKVYDSYGNVIKQSNIGGVDAAGSQQKTIVSTIDYDVRGRYIKSVTNAIGEKATNTYNGQSGDKVMGRITQASVTDANGRIITKFYDVWGRIVKEINPDKTETTYQFSSCENNQDCYQFGNAYLITEKHITGSPYVLQFIDRFGRGVGEISQGFSGEILKATFYDAQGRVSRQTEPNYDSIGVYSTQVKYDDFGRIIQEILPNGASSYRYYQGFETISEDSNGYLKTNRTNALGEAVTVIDDDYNELNFVYNAYGNLLRTYVKPRTGQEVLRTQINYNNYGRKIKSTDLDKGVWTYTYNSFGDLLTQTTANGDTTSLFYDLLGRKVRRDEPEGTACWVYGNKSNKTAGMLVEERSYASTASCLQSGYESQKTFAYYPDGKLKYTNSNIEANQYKTAFTYDSLGRLSETSYPNNLLTVVTKYKSSGHFYQRVDKATGKAYQTLTGMNARGQITDITYGNGATENKTYQGDAGWLDTITLSKGGILHQLAYQFDDVGNLEWRQHQLSSAPATFAETYSYDNLYRLYNRNISFSYGADKLPDEFDQSLSTRYDDWGNITSKTGTGHYKYDEANPYRLLDICDNAECTKQSIASSTDNKYAMRYDDQGNIINDGTREFTYTSYDLVNTMTKGQESSRFSYDINRKRLKRQDVKYENGSLAYYTTYYVGAYEKVARTGGGKAALTEQKLYVGNVVITKRSNNSTDTLYLHKDHQGSTTTITNAAGNVVQQFTYDPWGKQTAAYQGGYLANYTSPATTRGYTGHEHISHLDIIHMNGRIYDPTLGRFLQADPFIQLPDNMQNYNRYAYVLNNPMSYTDPSGFFLKGLFKAVKKYWRVIAAAVVTYFTAGAASGWAASWGLSGAASGAASGAIAGAAGGFVATGSLKGTLTGAFAGAVFGAIGASFDAKSGFFETNGAGHIGSHALAGGVISDLQGGKFGHGFWSAGLTKGANVNGVIDSFGAAYDAARIAVAAVIGGTVSKITGGKFGNGAVSAGFAQMLNGNSQIKGAKNNPIGHRMSGSIPIQGDDGRYYWADGAMHAKNFGSDYLAKQTGTIMSDYVTTTDKEKSYALGLVATGFSLGSAAIPSVIAAGGAYYYDPSDANALGMVAGPLAHGATYVHKPISEVINNIGNIAGVVSVTAPIADNYVERR